MFWPAYWQCWGFPEGDTLDIGKARHHGRHSRFPPLPRRSDIAAHAWSHGPSKLRLQGASIRISRWTSKGPRNPRLSQASHQICVSIKRDRKSPRARRGFLRCFWGRGVRSPRPCPAPHRSRPPAALTDRQLNPAPARSGDGRGLSARVSSNARTPLKSCVPFLF